MAYQYTAHRGKRVSPAHEAMLVAYEKSQGSVNINQGARTIAEQTGFWLHYLRYGFPLAARPTPAAPHIKYGRQHHAMDINAPQPAHSVADFYRAHGVPVAFNVSSEAWHMDTLDEAALIAAAAKLGAPVLPVLHEGSRGRSVVKLKKLLYAAGKRNFSGAQSSNRYNPNFNKWTTQTVKRYQRKIGETPDGVVGPTTWHALLTKRKA